MAKSRGNVLVTGGTGFVGRHLVNSLISKGESVVIVDDLSNSELNSHVSDPCQFQVKDVSESHVYFYNQDIRNETAILEIIKKHKIKHCVHLAAKVSVVDSFRDPHSTFSVNTGGTYCMLQACSLSHVESFVFASSAAVYGATDKLPIRETTPLEPVSPYGASKVAGEALVSAYSSTIRSTFCLRLFNIYGCYQRSDYAGVITSYADQLSKRLPLEVYGNGSQTRDFVHVDDVVSAILLAKDYPGEHSTYVVNIGTKKANSIIGLAEYMKKLFGLESSRIIFGDPQKGSILHSVPDITDAKKILNYTPSVSIETGLKKMLDNDYCKRIQRRSADHYPPH